MKSIALVEAILKKASEEYLDRIQHKYKIKKIKMEENLREIVVKDIVEIGAEKLELLHKVYTPAGIKDNPSLYQNYVKFLKGQIGQTVPGTGKVK